VQLADCVNDGFRLRQLRCLALYHLQIKFAANNPPDENTGDLVIHLRVLQVPKVHETCSTSDETRQELT
jgi:hypothetical protein